MRLFNRRNIFWAVAFVTVALLLWYVSPSLALWPRNIALTWSGDPSSTQTITWHTGNYGGSSKITFREEAALGESLTATGTVRQVETERGVIAVHSAQLTGLKPATRYRYQVGDGVFWSASHTFTTAPSQVQAFKFLLFGDSQGNSFSVWQSTLQTAYARNGDAKFLINVGDLVDTGLSYNQWDNWFQAGRGVIDTLPIMPVMGNHETYTIGGTIDRPVLYSAFFLLPHNGPAGLEGKVYSFDYGPAHFSVLDSQRQEEEEWLPQMLSLQQAWLEKDLAGTDKRWKVVLIHRPVYHNRPSRAADEDLRNAFTPLFDRYGVDVVFAGHDHVYARSYPLSGGKWKGAAGSGPVYITVGRSGTKTFARAQAKDWDAAFYNPLQQPNYLTVEVSGDRLLVKAFTLEGEMFDMWSKAANDGRNGAGHE